MRYINPQHRGTRLQRGRGVTSFLGSMFNKFLKPMFHGGVNLGKAALKNPDIQAGLKDVQSSAIKAGVRKIDEVLNPKATQPTRPVVKRKKKYQNSSY